ncbi:MbtH family protein [Micromonospora inyonensis]|uniref:MbtH protein n=1 Tax=Micromonospora inyonensis TaxID=47866 RepID=A0A1C6S7T6_9ACTN|nr:MbtH family protein [Micromonospora inyonensis]SCL25348.1 MbtH protein [Micromonospora inyonensis]
MNAFDDPEAECLVLVNAEEQHSLWPSAVGVPHGWTLAFGPATRDECVGYVEHAWPDIRPHSVRRLLSAAAAGDEGGR